MSILKCTPPKFHSLPLKNDGLKFEDYILSFWVPVTFQGRTVKLQECSISILLLGYNFLGKQDTNKFVYPTNLQETNG